MKLCGSDFSSPALDPAAWTDRSLGQRAGASHRAGSQSKPPKARDFVGSRRQASLNLLLRALGAQGGRLLERRGHRRPGGGPGGPSEEGNARRRVKRCARGRDPRGSRSGPNAGDPAWPRTGRPCASSHVGASHGNAPEKKQRPASCCSQRHWQSRAPPHREEGVHGVAQ